MQMSYNAHDSMNYILDLGVELDEMPTPARNLYSSIPRCGRYKFDVMKEILEAEPYTVSLVSDSQNTQHWFMIFPTYEDYVAFQMAWY